MDIPYKSFHQNGFCVIDNVIDEVDLYELEALVHHLSSCRSEVNLGGISKFNQQLISLHKQNPKLISQVQRIIPRTPQFYRVMSSPLLRDAILSLWQKDPIDQSSISDSLYYINNGVIFTFPGQGDRRCSTSIELGWHKDTFYTIPRSEFLHIWMPLFNNADKNIGSLTLCSKSHLDGIGKQVFDENETYNYMFKAPPSVINQYEHVQVNVKRGQVLIFDGRCFHKSGLNLSNNVRTTLIGIAHRVSHPEFKPIIPYYVYEGETPEQYFESVYGEKINTRINQSIDPKDEPFGGV